MGRGRMGRWRCEVTDRERKALVERVLGGLARCREEAPRASEMRERPPRLWGLSTREATIIRWLLLLLLLSLWGGGKREVDVEAEPLVWRARESLG